jgi:hypothetical protein
MEGGQMTNLQVLMLIGAFIALTFGSFLWFIFTWNADAEESIGSLPLSPTIILVQMLPQDAFHAHTRVTL